MIRDNNNLNKPLMTLFPSNWKETLGECENLEFRNLDHFKYTVSKITQKADNNCDVSYEKALEMLLKGTTDMDISEVSELENLVKSNLHKRGLITQEIYEEYKYASEGTQVGVDIAKYAAGEQECIITPTRQYVDFFYELYISISYEWGVSNDLVRRNVIKLIATIKELERQHIFIKITLIFPDRNLTHDSGNFFSSIPMFSHKESKDSETMCSVLNDRLLRKFFFAIIENLYGKNLRDGKGSPVELDGCLNIGREFNEVEFFQLVKTESGAE